MNGTAKKSWWKPALSLAIPLAAIAACGFDEPGVAPPEEDAGVPDVVDPNPADRPDAATGTDGGTKADAEPPPAPYTTSRSGTRLRRHLVEAGSGARRTIEFWDTELDVACTFQAIAGELRCLPRFDRAYFAGNTCTGQVVMLTEDSSCERAFGQVATTGAIYRRTMTEAADQTEVHQATANACLRHAPSGMKVWNANLIPLTDFVKGTEEDEPRSSGLTVRHINGADGSRVATSVHVGSSGAACDFAIEPGRCVPSNQGTLRPFFSDAACTSALAEVSSGSKPDVLVKPKASCGGANEYFAAGAELAPGSKVYRMVESVCEEIATPPGTHYAVGAPIAVTSFPVASIAPEGTGRVQALRRVDVDGKPLGEPHAFRDTKRGNEECTPALFEVGMQALLDGHELRCIPSNSGEYQIGFRDSACSADQRFAFASFAFDVCAPAPGDYVAAAGPGASANCGAPFKAYEGMLERGPELMGDVYRTRPTLGGGTSCTKNALGASEKRYEINFTEVETGLLFELLTLKKE